MLLTDKARSIAWWTVFGIAFGVIEATVVIYIRRLLHIPAGGDYAAYITGAGNGFGAPGITKALLKGDLLHVECLREAATILLLFAAACGTHTGWRQRLSQFCYTFAIWDLSYYLYLALAVGYPRSLFDRDIYFLIPVAWIGPVWFPALVAMPALILLSIRLYMAAGTQTVTRPAVSQTASASSHA